MDDPGGHVDHQNRLPTSPGDETQKAEVLLPTGLGLDAGTPDPGHRLAMALDILPLTKQGTSVH